jgi:hypothetical protein
MLGHYNEKKKGKDLTVFKSMNVGKRLKNLKMLAHEEEKKQ